MKGIKIKNGKWTLNKKTFDELSINEITMLDNYFSHLKNNTEPTRIILFNELKTLQNEQLLSARL